MSKAPDHCLYCDWTDPNCGFCEMGKPLDTQEDWDRSWGALLHPNSHHLCKRGEDCPAKRHAARDSG